MPMIDIHVPAGLVPADRRRELTARLTTALIHAEGHEVAEPFASNTGAFLHELPADAVATAAGPDARVVRIQAITPPAALDREGQRAFTAEATRIVADLTGDPGQAARTWVVLTEATEGGWGIAGTAFGRAEFAALAATS